ncbi:conserved hypothetical protein [Culex quinquefasciatus]|uniref:Uncharacterized protein n=1 Tax=Culex quinquefasciatus TaxID=7176 RepID=B0WYA5_CULQU|nr:conserved hypothetical protein [Culex quinquefasciatus]|eukprot:XP_001862377.1 conserved hypothetical protein [Culex quinquefasciatus]
MNKFRQNSLVFDFNVMPVIPELGTIQRFLQQQIKLDLSSVRNLQVNVSRNQVIIETTTPDQAQCIAKNHNSKHFIVHEKKRFLIPIFVEDGSIEVKVHDLPPRMPNHMIEDHLQQYGEIISTHDEVWRDFFPGVPNGVRVVRMKIRKPIPSFVKIEGLPAYIAHKNQIKTCRYCTQKLHAGQKCKGTNYNDHFSTTSNEDQEEHPEKTTEPEKKIIDNTCDLIFSERHENKERNLNTSIDHSNEKGNPQQTTNVPRKIDILSKKKAIVRLAKKKRIL